MPFGSAMKRCGSCATSRSLPCRPSRFSNTSRNMPQLLRRPRRNARCSIFTRGSFANSSRRACRWRWVRTLAHSRMAPRREFVLMTKYGMTPLAAVQADSVNGAKLLGWQGKIGGLKPGYFADIVAVPGDPLQAIGVLQKVAFVMMGGVVYRRD